METPANPVRARLATGECALGLIVRLSRGPEIARVARAAGYDFAYLDTQHTLFDPETLLTLIHALLGVGLAPVVRVRSPTDPDLGRLLDAGALGVVVPQVESVSDARAAVAAARFAPRGARSYTSSSPHHDYRPQDPAQAIARAEEQIVVVAMIETARGLAAVDEIAAVPGLDGLYVGVNDLALDLAGTDPDLDAALARVAGAARDHGLFSGCGGLASIQDRRRAADHGLRFLTMGSDLALLANAAAHEVATMRAELATHQEER